MPSPPLIPLRAKHAHANQAESGHVDLALKVEEVLQAAVVQAMPTVVQELKFIVKASIGEIETIVASAMDEQKRLRDEHRTLLEEYRDAMRQRETIISGKFEEDGLKEPCLEQVIERDDTIPPEDDSPANATSSQLLDVVRKARSQSDKEVHDIMLGGVEIPSFISSARRKMLYRIVTSFRFQLLMTSVIIAIAICIGYEIDARLRGEESEAMYIADHVFLVIYVVELFMVLLARGLDQLWKDRWVKLDAVIIALGVLTSWTLLPLMSLSSDDNPPAWVTGLEKALILRMLRILRLGKVMRFFDSVETLGKLVHGMIKSASAMASAMVLILATVYVLACVGAEMLCLSPGIREHAQAGPIVEAEFNTIPKIMLSLMRFTTADSISSLYTPLIEAEPWLLLYFAVTLSLLCYLLMNLVTAVVVEDAISAASEDREAEAARIRRMLKTQRPQIKKLFAVMDKSADHEIQLSEMLDSWSSWTTYIPADLRSVLSPQALVDLFEYIDVDGSGAISEEEFVAGVSHIALSNVPVEITQLINIVRHNRFGVNQAIAEIALLRKEVQRIFTMMSSWSRAGISNEKGG